MCSQTRHRPFASPVGTAYFAPTGLLGRSEGFRATHITLLRSYNPQLFNTIKERNSPAPRRGVSRRVASPRDSPPGRGKGWVVKICEEVIISNQKLPFKIACQKCSNDATRFQLTDVKKNDCFYKTFILVFSKEQKDDFLE